MGVEMELKKLLIVLGTSIALIFGIGWQQATAQASTWHWGMPKVLIGHWYVPHDNVFHTYMINGKTYSHTYSNDLGILNHTKYKYLGHHIYKVNGYEPVYTKGRLSTYFKWFSRNRIATSNSLDKYTNWHDGLYYRK